MDELYVFGAVLKEDVISQFASGISNFQSECVRKTTTTSGTHTGTTTTGTTTSVVVTSTTGSTSNPGDSSTTLPEGTNYTPTGFTTDDNKKNEDSSDSVLRRCSLLAIAAFIFVLLL
jgi:hypothetical protein